MERQMSKIAISDDLAETLCRFTNAPPAADPQVAVQMYVTEDSLWDRDVLYRKQAIGEMLFEMFINVTVERTD